MNIISKFIRQWRAFRLSLRLLKLIDPKKLEDINDILEEIYPGIKAEIRALVESYDIHATSKTLHYINTHGGIQKMADYYNNADKNGKDVMLSAFNKVFKPGARFEDAVLTLDSIAKQEGLGLYTQLIGDVKDSIVVVLLGVLHEIQENEAKAENTNAEEKNTTRTDNQPDEGVEYTFPMELLGKLYEYDNIVFKHISSEFEFASIVLRKPHAQILVECNGNKVLVYQILWRLRKLLPEKDQDTWINDIALECGYDVITISKKYKDDSNMKDEKKDILKELSSLFDEYDTKK